MMIWQTLVERQQIGPCRGRSKGYKEVEPKVYPVLPYNDVPDRVFILSPEKKLVHRRYSDEKETQENPITPLIGERGLVCADRHALNVMISMLGEMQGPKYTLESSLKQEAGLRQKLQERKRNFLSRLSLVGFYSRPCLLEPEKCLV